MASTQTTASTDPERSPAASDGEADLAAYEKLLPEVTVAERPQ